MMTVMADGRAARATPHPHSAQTAISDSRFRAKGRYRPSDTAASGKSSSGHKADEEAELGSPGLIPYVPEAIPSAILR